MALACLASAPTRRTRFLFAAYAVGWPLDRPGLQIFVVIPDTDEPWKRATVPFVTSVTAWSAVMLAASTAVRRTRLPAPLAAVLLGGAVTVVDSMLADLGERKKTGTARGRHRRAERRLTCGGVDGAVTGREARIPATTGQPNSAPMTTRCRMP